MRQYPVLSLQTSASESRPRELTGADLAAMSVGVQTHDARPVQNPPTVSVAVIPETLGEQSRPSDALLAAHSGTITPDLPSSGPRESRG
jgi:hypothetical protein